MRSAVVSVVIGVLLLAPSPAEAKYRRAGGKPIKGRYIVVLKDVSPGDVRATAVSLARMHGGTAFAPMITGGVHAFGMLLRRSGP